MKKSRERKGESGRIVSFFSGVARIAGLTGVRLHELLCDDAGNVLGYVIGFNANGVDALFFSDGFDLDMPIVRCGQTVFQYAGEGIVGRCLDGLGRPLDGLGPIKKTARMPLFRSAPAIRDRQPVSRPLTTGIKVVDATLPLGRGQRELIIGDRKLGKSTLASDTVLAQRHAEEPLICIYVLCGQKEQKYFDLISLFNQSNAFLYTVVVAAHAHASFAELYLAPFVGCAIGEYYRDSGRDAVVIYDDLSKHAHAYRDIALLLERAPGREAYPGDIFSLHAGLLERAAQLDASHGGGSLSALPIIETQEGDITGFISTNIISITDGQIYFENSLFQGGRLPAVNIGLSVSRVGSNAQGKALREATAGLRLELAQHKELQKLAQLETTRSADAQKKIQRGELLLQLMKQKKHNPFTPEEQAVFFYAVENGCFDDVDPELLSRFEYVLHELLRTRFSSVLDALKNGFTDEIKKNIRQLIEKFKQDFITSHV